MPLRSVVPPSKGDGELAAALMKFVESASGPVLVVCDHFCPRPRALPSKVTFSVEGDGVEPSRWSAVAFVAPDVGGLRRLASLLPPLGKTRAVALALMDADRAALLLSRAEWPALTAVVARTPGGGAFTVARFERPAPATAVIQQMARFAAPGRVAAPDGLHIARLPGWKGAPPADVGVRLLDDKTPVPADTTVPPDIVLADRSRILPVSDVTGRAPVVISASSLAGPVDERVLNPRGYIQRGATGIADAVVDDTGRVRVQAEGIDIVFNPAQGATGSGVDAMRGLRGVRLPKRLHPASALTVAGLAAAGIPMTGSPTAHVPGLSDGLVALLAAPVNLDDDLRREEHSIRLRRRALLAHATSGWRRALAADAFLPLPAQSSISVLLATRRPHQLQFALRQFARQRGVEAELVLVTHGFTADAGAVRELVGGRPVTVVPVPADVLFGDALNAGVRMATGDMLMKMDDDDWYAPDFLLDLLVARLHSGADLVGTTSEYVFLEQLNRTLRRNDESERFARFVAGGSMLVSLAVLREIGGFRRARRFVDASLLQSLLGAGASVYRAQGLGYVLRRNSSGHTWEPGLDFFLDPVRLGEEWSGFVPSRLLEHDAADEPEAIGG